MRHTTFAAQRAKDAIVDRLQELAGRRPSVEFTDPDLRMGVRFARETATLAIDLSGAPLHRRGYRQSAVEAPVKENLAAALLLRSGWPEIAAAGGAFADPMCGSGTFVIEAALIAGQHAPGLFRRRFGFERWLGHDAAAWTTVRDAAQAQSTLSCAGARPVQRQRREPRCRTGDARERDPRRDRRVRGGPAARARGPRAQQVRQPGSCSSTRRTAQDSARLATSRRSIAHWVMR